MTEKCDYVFHLTIRPSERKALEQRAGNRPIAAFIREQIGLAPARPGRRWPEDPALRHWRRPVDL